jgi:hypothetical protein
LYGTSLERIELRVMKNMSMPQDIYAGKYWNKFATYQLQHISIIFYVLIILFGSLGNVAVILYFIV